MSLPFLSLYEAAAVGPGVTHDLETVQAYHHMAVTVENYAGSGTIQVDLEISLDGATWVSYAAGGASDDSQLSFTGNGTATSPCSGTGAPIPSYARPARFVRANLKRYDGTITAGDVIAYVASC